VAGLGGAPAYLAPERWGKGYRIDARADLYALGVLLFRMLTGEYPVRPDRPTAVGWADVHGRGLPRSLRSLRSDLPGSLEELIHDCLARYAEQRPASAREVARRLAEVWEEMTGQPYARPESAEAKLLADGRNNRAVILLDAGLADRGPAETAW